MLEIICFHDLISARFEGGDRVDMCVSIDGGNANIFTFSPVEMDSNGACGFAGELCHSWQYLPKSASEGEAVLVAILVAASR